MGNLSEEDLLGLHILDPKNMGESEILYLLEREEFAISLVKNRILCIAVENKNKRRQICQLLASIKDEKSTMWTEEKTRIVKIKTNQSVRDEHIISFLNRIKKNMGEAFEKLSPF